MTKRSKDTRRYCGSCRHAYGFGCIRAPVTKWDSEQAVCCNPDSDHYQHIITDVHPACEAYQPSDKRGGHIGAPIGY